MGERELDPRRAGLKKTRMAGELQEGEARGGAGLQGPSLFGPG
jgi:hypothetical protein